MVTSSLERRMLSRLFCNDSRYVFFLTSSARSSAASTVPNCWMSSTEPLSPMPGAPGMLSMESPRRAMTSMTRSGRHAEDVFDAGGIEDEVVFGGVEDADVVVDELHHVLVGGDDEDVVAEGGELAGEGADDVVGLEAFVAEDGDAEGFEGAADVGKLLGEVGRASRRGWLCSRRSRSASNCWVLMLNLRRPSSRWRARRGRRGRRDRRRRRGTAGAKSLRSLLIMLTKT